MSKLQMPRKGESAAMMAELQAEHAAQAAAEPIEETNVTTLQDAHVTTHEPSNVLTPEPATVTANELTPVHTNEPAPVTSLEPPTAPPVTAAPTRASRKRPPSPLPPDEPRTDRLVSALDRASQDAIAVVTVRVPASLNRYMDDYVARINRVTPQGRYRKQDAVAEAFAAFYADHPMPPPPASEDL